MESPVTRQVRHVLAVEIRKPEIEAALSGLQDLGFEPTSRGGLKVGLKLKALSVYRTFLSTYQPLVSHLNSASGLISDMKSRLEELQTDLSLIENRTSDTLKTSKSLRSEREGLRLKQVVLTNLLETVTLTHGEIEMLTNPELPVTDEYFDTLKKLLGIKKKQEMLESAEHKLVAVSLEEYLTQIQEAAYEKIFRFMQQQAKLLEHEAFSGYDKFATAVKYLKERPLYYAHFRAEIVRCRQLYIVRKFQEASSIVIPSESSQAEAFGRLLAWIHSALISEHQLISAILESVETVENPAPGSEETLQETTVLDLIADALSRHFAIKSEKLLAGMGFTHLAKAFSVVVFAIKSITDSNLLTFTSKLVQEMFKVRTNIEERILETAKVRINHVKALGLQLPDLRVPPAFLELLDELVEVGKEMETAEDLETFRKVCEVLVTGGIAYYEDLVQKSGWTIAALLMLLNVLDSAKFKLSGTELALSTVELLEKKLTEVESAVLSKVQLRTKQKPEEMTLVQLNRIKEMLEEGDVGEFLAVDKVRNKNVARRLQSGVVTALLQSYEEGYAAQNIKPQSTPSDLRDIIRKRFQ